MCNQQWEKHEKTMEKTNKNGGRIVIFWKINGISMEYG
jgi:hypothetical protein